MGPQLKYEGQHVIKKDHHGHHKGIHREVVQSVGAFRWIQFFPEAEDGRHCQKQKAQHQLTSLKAGASRVDLNMLLLVSRYEGADTQDQEAVCDYRSCNGNHHKTVKTAGESSNAHHQFHQISQPHTHHAAVAITEVFAQLIHEDRDQPGQGNQRHSEGQKAQEQIQSACRRWRFDYRRSDGRKQ